MLIDPLHHTLSTSWGLPLRRPRYVARIPIRRKAVQARPAPVEPLSCWHVWLTDTPPEAPAETFGAIFERAAAIAAERAAAYRAHEAGAEPERPRFDLRA